MQQCSLLLAWRAWSNNDHAYITYMTYMRRRTWKCQNLALDVHPHPQTSSANSDISDSLTSCVVKNSCLENLTLSLFFGNRHSEDRLWKTCLLHFSFVCLSALTYLISGLRCIPRYVTSAYIDLSPEAREQQENAGCVFRVTGHGARGLPPHRYGKIEPKARL